MRRMLAMLLLCAAGAVFAGPTAWLDRYAVDEGEILRLTIETEGDVPGDPDTDPLLPDFTIDGIANGHRQIRSANGFINYTTWTITLRPRRAGRLQIPSLRINGAPTPPLALEVRPSLRGQQQGGGQAFLRGSVDNPRPWRQAMVIYTVRLFYDLPIAGAALNVPTPSGALMTQLKGDRVSVATLDGRRYKVIERRHALFPENAGNLTIPAPTLEAQVPVSTSARLDIDHSSGNPLQGGGEFDSFITATRPIRIHGEPIALEVRPPPPDHGGRQWLPAASLKLEEQIETGQMPLHAGDPVTRTITLTAEGLMAEQLPPPVATAPRGVYLDKPQRRTIVGDRGVTGILTQRIVHVPQQAGELTLPPIELRWWDTTSGQSRKATLPAHSYHVEATTPQKAADGSDGGKTNRAGGNPESTARTLPELARELLPTGGNAPWPWLAAATTLLWLATLWLWLHERRRHRPRRPIEHQQRDGNDTLARKRFHQACREDLAGPARHYLLAWARAHWPDDPPAGLEALAERIGDDGTAKLLKQLDSAVFSEEAGRWRGRKLASKLKKLPGKKSADKAFEPLPPLYPR